ncbi:MAG: signal recognition particle-docking protein FtsY [Candidatus Latescibacterota bacterium]
MLGGLLGRVREGLARTRTAMSQRISAVIGAGGRLDPAALDELEEALIEADVGVATAREVIEELRARVRTEGRLGGSTQVMRLLREQIAAAVTTQDRVLPLAGELPGKPFVILVVGVNGVGKTTTVGKLAKRYADAGKQVLVAACDTFRAAAIPQLEIWTQRAGVAMVRPQQGADPASVAFDALSAARARGVDVLLVDTAGRLHNKVNLMEELRKIRRALAKHQPDAPHEVLLVLDATTGQNTLSQAREFHQATQVTGLVLTKLDGTARGGIAVALRREMGIPVKLIGVGEGVDDLQPFDGQAFADALFEEGQG